MAPSYSPARGPGVGLGLVVGAGVLWGTGELCAADPAPEVETRPATLVGINGLTVNGRIHPHGLPTRQDFD